MEDFNYLLHREQVELIKAEQAACVSSRASHRALARLYAARIAEHRHPYRTPDSGRQIPWSPAPFGSDEIVSPAVTAYPREVVA